MSEIHDDGQARPHPAYAPLHSSSEIKPETAKVDGFVRTLLKKIASHFSWHPALASSALRPSAQNLQKFYPQVHLDIELQHANQKSGQAPDQEIDYKVATKKFDTQYKREVSSTTSSASIQGVKQAGRGMVEHNEDASFSFTIKSQDGSIYHGHGVADGHSGIHASRHVAQNIEAVVTKQLPKDKPLDVATMHDVMDQTSLALEEGYFKAMPTFTDNHLYDPNASEDDREHAEVIIEASKIDAGTTLSWTLQTPTHLITSNLGDSRTILSEPNQTIQMSEDADVSSPHIKNRYLNQGFEIKTDFSGKEGFGEHHSPIASQIGYKDVATDTRVTAIPLKNIQSNSYAISASDGVWKVLSTNCVGKLVQAMSKDGLTDRQISENLVKIAHLESVKQWEKEYPDTDPSRLYVDDITVSIHKVK